MMGDPSDEERTLSIAWGLEVVGVEKVHDKWLESQRDKLPGGHSVDWQNIGNRRITLNQTRVGVGMMI